MGLYLKYQIYRQIATLNLTSDDPTPLIWKHFSTSFKREFLPSFKPIDVSKFLRGDLRIITDDEVRYATPISTSQYYQRIRHGMNVYIPPSTKQLILSEPELIASILADSGCDYLDVFKLFTTGVKHNPGWLVSNNRQFILLAMYQWLRTRSKEVDEWITANNAMI